MLGSEMTCRYIGLIVCISGLRALECRALVYRGSINYATVPAYAMVRGVLLVLEAGVRLSIMK